jgi:EAL domain-containing protein (putative c-di-GMP-specific phosphodiesterase class I)
MDFHTEHEDKSAIVSAIMVMAEQLGINCIIEGVELEQHAEYFRQKGVYGIQGYFYHKPMPGDQMQVLLRG